MDSYSIDEMRVGQSAEVSRRVTEDDINAYAQVTGDHNPLHVDAEFAAKGMFGERVAHGMFSAGLVSAVLGTRLPGVGCVYLSQDIRFRAPVRIGDTIRAVVTVTELNTQKNRVTLRTECINQAGMVVMDGSAVLKPVVKG